MSITHNNTTSRTYAFKFLYRLLLDDFSALKDELKNDPENLDDAFSEFEVSYSEEDKEHPNNSLDPKMRMMAQKLIHGVLNNENDLREKIGSVLTNRKISSLEKVDYTLLLLGGFELLKFKEAPRNVILNEYINLGREFGTEESPKFINGVLDNLK